MRNDVSLASLLELLQMTAKIPHIDAQTYHKTILAIAGYNYKSQLSDYRMNRRRLR
jgi:hypothetical protein